jgi:hypothetical protein
MQLAVPESQDAAEGCRGSVPSTALRKTIAKALVDGLYAEQKRVHVSQQTALNACVSHIQE